MEEILRLIAKCQLIESKLKNERIFIQLIKNSLQEKLTVETLNEIRRKKIAKIRKWLMRAYLKKLARRKRRFNQFNADEQKHLIMNQMQSDYQKLILQLKINEREQLLLHLCMSALAVQMSQEHSTLLLEALQLPILDDRSQLFLVDSHDHTADHKKTKNITHYYNTIKASYPKLLAKSLSKIIPKDLGNRFNPR